MSADNWSTEWTRDHWWSSYHELKRGSEIIASLRVKGSSGIAQLVDRRFRLKRSRWPAFISLTAEDTGALEAQLSVLPLPVRADFEDGESFLLGWVNFWRRTWAWTRESGETVLPTNSTGLSYMADTISLEKTVLPSVLQRAISVLPNPLF